MAGRGIRVGVAGVAEDRAVFRLKRVINPEKLGSEFFHFLLPAEQRSRMTAFNSIKVTGSVNSVLT